MRTNTKKMSCAYLYSDGHAVIIYTKQDPDAGEIEFAEIHERWTEARLEFRTEERVNGSPIHKGRLCFSRYEAAGLMRLAKMAKVIIAKENSLRLGSENTRKLGIPVGSLEFSFDGNYGGDCAHFQSVDSILSCPYKYQPEHDEKFDPDIYTWGTARVAKVHRIPANDKLNLKVVSA